MRLCWPRSIIEMERTGSGISREPYATYRERKAQVDKEYLGALDNLIREYGAREICAEAYICKADLLRNMGSIPYG